MDSYLFKGEVIRWNRESPIIERVVWTDDVLAFTIDINAKTGFPQPRLVSDILDALATGVAEQVSDPWARVIRDEDLGEQERKVRDKAWQIVSALAFEEPDIYYRQTRGPLVKRFVENYNSGKTESKLDIKTVYGYLRRFWQRGQTKTALTPDFANSSGKGTLRNDVPKRSRPAKRKGNSDTKLSENLTKDGVPKRGRPRQFKDDPEVGIGVNTSKDDRSIFRSAIIRHYFRNKENTLETVYELMVEESYAQEVYYDESDVKMTRIRPVADIPSIDEFRNFYSRHIRQDVKRVTSSRQGSKHFALNYRAVTGSSKAETRGAGSRFQIDATVLDIYICSKFKREWIIGRPVLYVVIDVFSQMVVGMYVGLEGPSWTGAMMALLNCAEDKVEFCQRYGREITPEEWPCHHRPSAILGDRGELVGMPVEERYIPNLHVEIENAPSGRPDFKGLVEGVFPRYHKHTKPFVSGFVNPRRRQQGKRDYRFEGELDLDQITRMAIDIVLYYNNYHYLEKYERDEEMIAANVPKIPLDLWNWSITRRSGGLRPVKDDLDFVKFCLLPTFPVTITESGLKLKLRNLPAYNINHPVDLYYTCDKAASEQWFERVRSGIMSKSDRKLKACLDLRAPEMMYLPNADRRTFEPCTLTDVEDRYQEKHFEDIICLFAREKLDSQRYRGKKLQAQVDLNAQLRATAERGHAMTQDALDNTPTSGSQRIADMGTKRTIERQLRDEALKNLQSNSQSSEPETTKELVPPDSSASSPSNEPETIKESASPDSNVTASSQSNSPRDSDSTLDLLLQIRQREKRGRS